MTFNIDIGFASLAGRKNSNENFCAAMLPDPGQEGMSKEAAQTTVISLVRDYYATPETWGTTVALDRIIGAQNAWLAGINRRRHPAMGLTTLRVSGLLDATLQDVNRMTQRLPIPHRLKIGELIDGLTVTATVADNGINLLYQVRDTGTRTLYALKTLHPAPCTWPGRTTPRSAPCWRMKPGWPAACRPAARLTIWSIFTSAYPPTGNAAPFTCCMTGTRAKPCSSNLAHGHRFSVQQALVVAAQTARALGRLHRQCVIHRGQPASGRRQGAAPARPRA